MAMERAGPDIRTSERRRYVRYAEDTKVLFVEVGGSRKAYEGYLRDLSAGGLCLMTSREFSVGTQLCLGIFFEHSLDDPLMVLADIRRCSVDDDGFALGLKFVRGTPKQHDALASIQHYLVDRHGG